MSQRLKVSVVTPVLNGARFIRESMESVLAQTGDFDLEYIIRDGGSTDGTLAIVAEYARDCIVVSEPDDGPQQAINAGMALATGDILAWLNADDVYEPGALQAAVTALSGSSARAWCYGRCRIIDENGRERRRPVTWYKNLLGWRYSRQVLLCENFINQPATFWRRELWRETGGLSSAVRIAFDYELWMKMAAVSAAIPIHRYLARFRRHAASLSEKTFETQFAEELQLARQWGTPVHGVIHRVNCWKILAVYRLLHHAGRTRTAPGAGSTHERG